MHQACPPSMRGSHNVTMRHQGRQVCCNLVQGTGKTSSNSDNNAHREAERFVSRGHQEILPCRQTNHVCS